LPDDELRMRCVRLALGLLLATGLHASLAGAETHTSAATSSAPEDFALASASSTPALEVPGLAVLLLDYASPQAGSLILCGLAGAGLIAISRRKPLP
jgi:hypothetical protein